MGCRESGWSYYPHIKEIPASARIVIHCRYSPLSRTPLPVYHRSADV
uniref:Translation initiation factor-like protein n=1 Tax=Podoviridae sp. ct9f93 TaxID=2826544 RepID=A0A8S5NF19_9CAUD|nr:MAG TPA: translation initiation factor-like protein [Podoviridae sp. ct9f93]